MAQLADTTITTVVFPQIKIHASINMHRTLRAFGMSRDATSACVTSSTSANTDGLASTPHSKRYLPLNGWHNHPHSSKVVHGLLMRRDEVEGRWKARRLRVPMTAVRCGPQGRSIFRALEIPGFRNMPRTTGYSPGRAPESGCTPSFPYANMRWDEEEERESSEEEDE
ncbi:hypothetical protein PM082_016486 [Marasmius tenuissimus]|nr:hypothetical protein PM082_016486 [Marasmius tenuissimus]